MATIHYGVTIPAEVINGEVSLEKWLQNLTDGDFNIPLGPDPLVGTNFGAAGTVEDVDENGLALMSTGVVIDSHALWMLLGAFE